jgi:hypothetical protein
MFVNNTIRPTILRNIPLALLVDSPKNKNHRGGSNDCEPNEEN